MGRVDSNLGAEVAEQGGPSSSSVPMQWMDAKSADETPLLEPPPIDHEEGDGNGEDGEGEEDDALFGDEKVEGPNSGPPFARWNLLSLLVPSLRAPRFRSSFPLRRNAQGAAVVAARARRAALPMRLLAAWPCVALSIVAAALVVGMPVVVALLFSYSSS